MTKIRTCEFVSPKHPDKICDFIADSILDAYLKKDENSRVAIEVMGGHGHITISGEVTSLAQINMESIVKNIVGPKYKIHVFATHQSKYIAQGVDKGGAGDQGIMVGFATNETKNFMPLEYEFARNLCREIYKKYPNDGKVQITLLGKTVTSVVASFQNSKTPDLFKLTKKIIQAKNYYINEAGEWPIGGFDSDSGLSGRKIVIDNYGPQVPVGGGSFSGKDYTKVDRSGAYMARKIAVDLLKKFHSKEVIVKLAYVIGEPQPVMNMAIVDGKEMLVPSKYDLSPLGIKKFLKLDQLIYAKTSVWGHFGRNFLWDK